jgi:hypothetical protein
LSGRKLHNKLDTMNWITRSSLIFLILCATISAQSQENSTSNKKASTYRGLYLGASASTNGWGVNARYAFNDKFSLRTGYESLSFSYDFDFSESDISYDAEFDFKTGGILLLADYTFTKNLYISGGVIFNSYNPEITGIAVSDLEYGDIIIPAEDIGTFKIEAKSELKVSPYVGAGYQAFMGKRNGVVFRFETGLYYMGPPDLTIEADGLLAPSADPDLGHDEYLEYQFDAYKIYPVIKLNLAIKIF